jgi:hypothetical protein
MARRSVETEAMLELADELTKFQEAAKTSNQPEIHRGQRVRTSCVATASMAFVG